MAKFEAIIPLIKKWEGGLSKDRSDTASSDPVPDGSGNHTNKGVTWSTFKANSKKLGYVPTPALFYKMPDSIWIPLLKVIFWDYYINGDKINSLAVAFYLVDWAWGSGNWAIKNLQQVLNRSFGYNLKVDGDAGPKTIEATNKVDSKKLLELLKAERLDFYQQLVKNNPSQSKWLNGWNNRANDMYNFALQNLPAVVGVGLGSLFFLGLSGFGIYKLVQYIKTH